MVFSPYRLFCFLLLKRAGISTVQASFMYNETAATRKASIYDFFLANTMHDFLYSICGTKCERFSSVQVQAYPENCYISRKTKAAGLPPIPLDVYFFANANSTAAAGRFLYSNRSASVKPIWKATTSTKNKAVQFSPIPLDVYFLPTQTARLPHGVFSTRICASNRSASVKPIREAATSTKIKAVLFSPIPLVVYFLPTQTARLPQGVFSTRICASNRSANADT